MAVLVPIRPDYAFLFSLDVWKLQHLFYLSKKDFFVLYSPGVKTGKDKYIVKV